MKTKSLLLTAIALVFGIALASCQKDDPTTATPTLVSETKNVHSTYVEFEWSIEFPGSFQSGVELSLREDMSDSIQMYQGTQSGNKFKVNIENLIPNTNYYYRIVVWNPARRDVVATSGFKTDSGVPALTTDEPSNVTQTTVTLGGGITFNGGIAATSCGVCWSTSKEPTVDDSYMEADVTSEHFTVNVSGLEPETKYYARAYATNRAGTGYGNEVTFFTGDIMLSQVTTMEVKNVEWTTAVGVGEVIDDGGGVVIDRGFCWSIENQIPTINDNFVSDQGQGLGLFEVQMTGLLGDETYFCRAYSKNGAGCNYGEVKSFSTKALQLPTVEVTQVINNDGETSDIKAKVVSDGGANVTARGVCWSTSPHPLIDGQHVSSGSGVGDYTASLIGLSPKTTYYACAYAINSVGISYSEEVCFTTPNVVSITIEEIDFFDWEKASIKSKLTKTGSVTVKERGVCWSATPDPLFTGQHIACGNEVGDYNVMLTDLDSETTYYIRAYVSYRINTSVEVEYSDSQTITTTAIPPTPEGAIGGFFSISERQKIWFSQGNLQYQASTNTWRFADNQWDYVGDGSYGTVYENGEKCDNENISSTYSGWIDLFGWGTSGYDHGAICYQPWSISTDYEFYYAYGSSNCNLNGQSGQADWGYNAISNGGNEENFWRTLTTDEWAYIFNSRNTTSSKRFAKACVNEINGVILLPDDWNVNFYYLNSTDDGSVDYSSNTISASEWTTLEQHGAVFLPAAGERWGTSIDYVGSHGYYWNATLDSFWGCVAHVYFTELVLNTNDHNYGGMRSYGDSVRLVRNAQ